MARLEASNGGLMESHLGSRNVYNLAPSGTDPSAQAIFPDIHQEWPGDDAFDNSPERDPRRGNNTTLNHGVMFSAQNGKHGAGPKVMPPHPPPRFATSKDKLKMKKEKMMNVKTPKH